MKVAFVQASDVKPMERITLGGAPPHLEQDHLERYRYASLWVYNKRVLDAGCGTGYGSLMMYAAGAAYVAGVDKHIKSTHPDVSFICRKLERLPDTHSYDVVTCFEVIEHVPNPVEVLHALRGALRPGGVLFISTPNRDITSPDGVVRNPHHVTEYTPRQFEDLMRGGGFEIGFTMGQRWQMVPRFKIPRKIYKTLFKPYRWSSPVVSPRPMSLFEPEYMMIVTKGV